MNGNAKCGDDAVSDEEHDDPEFDENGDPIDRRTGEEVFDSAVAHANHLAYELDELRERVMAYVLRSHEDGGLGSWKRDVGELQDDILRALRGVGRLVEVWDARLEAEKKQRDEEALRKARERNEKRRAKEARETAREEKVRAKEIARREAEQALARALPATANQPDGDMS